MICYYCAEDEHWVINMNSATGPGPRPRPLSAKTLRWGPQTWGLRFALGAANMGWSSRSSRSSHRLHGSSRSLQGSSRSSQRLQGAPSGRRIDVRRCTRVTADIDGRSLQGSSRSSQGSSRSSRSLQGNSGSVQGSSRSSYRLQGSSNKDEKEEEINKVKPPCSYERRARPWEWLPCDWTRPETKEATSKTRHYSGPARWSSSRRLVLLIRHLLLVPRGRGGCWGQAPAAGGIVLSLA
jgi:hypothetical protein